ncbi:hypothetical protein FXN61_02570 [Lentzea sp. PSKA42]|uniref:Uncharacterized protein n=1 Tax=Lentzea indica TaxID=2604800 RepID=A0ABX1FA30_9PSEU|nr:hypothetical protein [Lentzea indica]NKE55763.1 hypothetical protein [Lentzea indica]
MAVVVVVVLEEEDGADDELDATVCDCASVGVGISEGVLISDTRAGLSSPEPVGSPDANDPTCGAST